METERGIMKDYCVGADIGGTTIKLGLFRSVGELIYKWSIPTRKEDHGSRIFGDIKDSVMSVLEERGIDLSDVEGLGVDVPGPVLPDGTVNRCVNVGWGVIKAGEMFSREFGGLKTAVLNDANAAALGEMWKGAAKGVKNVCLATLGTGVGGGIIVDGRIVTGSFGAGGEIGHMTMDEDEEETCNCGKKGCLEQYSSGNGIARLARLKLGDRNCPETSLRQYDEVDAKVIYDEAKKGDKVALELVDDLSRYLARAFSYVSAVTDPEVFVIGGGVSKNGPIVKEHVEKFFKQYAFHASRKARFELAALGNDAGIYGSVKAVLDKE